MKFEIFETHKSGLIGEINEQNFAGITVVMPATDIAQAVLSAQRMQRYAGTPMRMVIVNDSMRQGFVKTINAVSNRLKPDYLAYVAQDALAGKNWLKNAFDKMSSEGKSVCAFNEGVQDGFNAVFGLVKAAFSAREYGQHNIFFESYVSHRADDEISLLAKLQKQYTYASDALLMEVDYRSQKNIHEPDVQLYFQREKILKNKYLLNRRG